MLLRYFVALFCSASLLMACVGPESEKKGVDYRSAKSAPTLEIPPDLSKPELDERYQIPQSGATSLSQYEAMKAAGQGKQTRAVLPEIPKARMVREGGQRWLSVDLPAEQLWPLIKQFWEENGFILLIDDSRAGVMETDWAENRAKIASGWLRDMLGKVFDRGFDAGERDKFRTRLERTNDGRSTEIYISHRGVSEEYVDSCDTTQTAWVFRPSDPELEAQMNMKLLLVLGYEEKRAQAIVKSSEEGTPFERAKVVNGVNGQPVLVLNDAFDRAWRRVGLALDRVGFTVEDRDRSQGLYYVRYIDPDEDSGSGGKKGILSALAFWRSDEPVADVSKMGQYRVFIVEAGGQTMVSVQNREGNPETSSVTPRILKLLHEQLR